MPRNPGIEKALNEYKKRRDTFEVRRSDILEALFAKYPKLGELKREYASLRINQRANREAVDYSAQYKKVDDEYNKLLGECLAKESISLEVLEYVPSCPICNDTGYVGGGEKKYCTCIISKAAQLVLTSSRINSDETFANSDLNIFNDTQPVFKNATQRHLTQRLYDYLAEWTKAFPANEKTQLVFMGNVGLGKSYCLNAIAYEVITRGYSAMLTTSFSINEAAFDEIKHSDSSALNMMRTVDLLLIDDLGGEQVLNNITCPTLLNILNERIRRNLHTVISTNLNRDLLEERYGTRVVSRMFDKAKTFVPLIMGQDIRKKHP